MAGSQTVIAIRPLSRLDEFAEIVRLQEAIWGFDPTDLLPMRFLAVLDKVGGHIFGAYDGDRMIGFCFAMPGIKPGPAPYLHSHMLGVLPDYRDRGVGRRLKLSQREDALARGIVLIEWTFDPLELKNAFFNIERLGAIVRRYIPNQYGITASPLHGGLPTDRCYAEWRLDSARVNVSLAGGRHAAVPREKISYPRDIARIRAEDPVSARQIQRANALQFQQAFARGLAVTGFERGAAESSYLLEPWGMKIERVTLRQIRMPLVHVFETSFGRTRERQMILVEVQGDGIAGWGEVTAGEHPFYNEEWTDSAWLILRDYAAPRILGQELAGPPDVYPLTAHIRGHNMAKGGLEAAVWDLAARREGVPLWKKIGGGARREIPCGVSIGIQDSVEQLLEIIECELAAGYQRIKMKIKPGWDVEVVRRVRARFPGIKLMADANSAYTLADAAHLRRLDEFYLMMIEQPLGHDDIVDHAALQATLETPVCLDECIRTAHHAEQAIGLRACGIINIKLGRVAGFAEARRVHDVAQAAGIPVWCGGMLEAGIGRAHNVALATLPNFVLPGDVSASRRYWARDIIQPPVETTPRGTIEIRDEPGFGYALDRDFIRSITVREETVG